MNSKTAGVVRKLKSIGDTETYLWQNSLAAGQPPLLCGYPVEFDENMPDIAANAFPIAFGDWARGYMITDRIGVRILRDPFTNKPYVMFYATKRVGGGLLHSDAIKLLKIAAT
jgi:HK97 family phage major capsid protein